MELQRLGPWAAITTNHARDSASSDLSISEERKRNFRSKQEDMALYLTA